METFKKFFSNVWNVVGTVIAVLLAIVGIERMRRKNAESELRNAETNADSKVLDAKLDNNKDKLDSIDANTEKAKEATDKESISSLNNWFNKR